MDRRCSSRSLPKPPPPSSAPAQKETANSNWRQQLCATVHKYKQLLIDDSHLQRWVSNRQAHSANHINNNEGTGRGALSRPLTVPIGGNINRRAVEAVDTSRFPPQTNNEYVLKTSVIRQQSGFYRTSREPQTASLPSEKRRSACSAERECGATAAERVAWRRPRRAD